MSAEETTPFVAPTRMTLAPHARFGRRINAATAIVVLLFFHLAMVVTGILNWNSPCEENLALFLVLYGGAGLLFVYVLAREWLFYARLSSLPSSSSLLLLILFYLALCAAGGTLSYYTILVRDTCRLSDPLLYRWCAAAVLFFGIVVGLFLLVPCLRCGTRCLLAPFALCLIDCVETVGVDVEIGDGDQLGAAGGGGAAAAAAGAGAGAGDKEAAAAAAKKRKEDFDRAAATFGIILCAPCYILFYPFYICFRPFVRGFGACIGATCAPLGQCTFKAFETCGCIVYEDGVLSFQSPLTCERFGACCVPFARLITTPGCVAPGRSVIALFVNTAAILWFFVYLLFDLYSSWGVVCSSRDPGTTFKSDPFGWLTAGAPTPIHWLLLIFVVSGVALALISFCTDIFSPPSPPPRSYYEAALWRGRRQVCLIGVILLITAFVGWGIALVYYVLLEDDDCANSDNSLYNIALLVVIVLFTIVALILCIGCGVICDACCSGRLKFVFLQSNRDSAPPPIAAELYAKNDLADERLMPGVEARRV